MPLWTPTTPDNTLVESGEETVRRDNVTSGALATGSGTLRLTYFKARKTEQTTQVRLLSGSTAAGATPTLVRAGIYSIDTNGDGTLIGAIANDTALLAATSTGYTRSWTTPFTKTAGTTYAVALIVVTGAATPTLAGAAVTSAADMALAPRLSAALASQTDLPASFTAAGLTTSITRFYALVLP